MDYIKADLLLELEEVEERIRDLDKQMQNLFWYVNSGDTSQRQQWENRRLTRIDLCILKDYLQDQLFKYNL